MIITRQHVFTVPGFSARRGFCRAGARRWFESYGLDWRSFVRDGIAEERVLALHDAFADAVVDWAHRCQAEACDGKE